MPMIKTIPFLLILVLSFYCFGQTDPCVTTDKKLIKALQPLRDEQDMSKANQLFQELNSKYPTNAEISFIMAQKAYAQAGKLSKDSKKATEAATDKLNCCSIVHFDFSQIKLNKRFSPEGLHHTF